MKVRDVTVTGAALTPFNRRKDGTGFRDWALSAFEMALERSGLERSDIDALYIASESDFFHLQLNPASVLATEFGLTGVAATRCEGGGASGQVAVHTAARAIQAGAAKHAAVIGVDPSASSLSGDAIRTLYGFSFDAWTDGMTGLTSTALYALSFQAFAAEHGITEADLATVTLQNRGNAYHNPGAHLPRKDSLQDIADNPAIASPYRRLHCSPLSDGAAAIILSRTDATPRTRIGAARIAGMGAATDHMHLGARADPGFFTAKQIAMQRACAEAGATPAEIGLAELYDAYAGTQLQAIAALGLSEDVSRDLKDGAFAPTGRCAINLSGGLMGQGAPVGATGVGQTATCALLLEGRYHPALQPDTLPRYALADTHGGVCTLSAVTILERAERAA
ncbi:thiolase family protein [uncultured Roseobacter sp.]|uniref:thiolase family protein n=1 Tax=uncultured Roseobacter sp. TaxID=114847 RepID=UPI00260CCDB7|nr:thiolase family protein [uncultured Roseobacter sp.]